MSTQAQKSILVESTGHVLVIRLNRPEVRNAIDLATANLLEAEIDRFEADGNLRVAVLTGSPSVFCAGVDLRAVASSGRPRTAKRGWFGLNEAPPSKPMIAAVEGAALAGGFELALACDLIVASNSSVFGLPEVTRGLIASAGGLLRLPRQLTSQVAAEIALTGDPMEARRLYDLGLVNRLSVPGEALAMAMVMAERIAENAPLSVAASKRVMAAQGSLDIGEAWRAQEADFEPVRNSADYREGIAAFAEKRRPNFQGK